MKDFSMLYVLLKVDTLDLTETNYPGFRKILLGVPYLMCKLLKLKCNLNLWST